MRPRATRVTTRHFTVADVPFTPWTNGRGTTRELLSWPPAAGVDRFEWRVSVASIAADGPFSTFPEVQRTITLLEGDGIRLRGRGVDHRLDTCHVPLELDGTMPLQCTLLGRRQCTALNVMVRGGLCHVTVISGAAALSATHGLLLSLAGVWYVGSDPLASGTGLWWDSSPGAKRVEPTSDDDKLAVITWEPK